MAPEQLNKESFPLTDDFSKIDVWALGVTLVHMLTHKLPFANNGLTVLEDKETYEAFVADPSAWLVAHGADLAEEELIDASDLLKQMLAFEKKERISVAQVLKSKYVSNHHKAITKQDIRAFQRKVLNLEAL
jgi:serine/threonine protein kinase